jgi:hypothetical protein
VQSANALEDHAIQAMTKIAAPAFPTMQSSCVPSFTRRLTKMTGFFAQVRAA